VNWPLITIGECCEIVSGSTPSTSVKEYWDGDIFWATAKDLSNQKSAYIEVTERKITQAGLDSCSSILLPAGSVLFSSRAPIGLVAINTVPMCTNQGFKNLIPNSNLLHNKYLYHWLRSNRQRLEDLGNGATFKEVSKSVVARVEILLPPLHEQQRIAAILDKADALREKRRQALAKLDALLQSVFLEMFGDPVTNPKGWETDLLDHLCKNITDGTHDTPLRTASGVPFITSKNIRPFEIDLNELDYVTVQTHEEIKKRCNPQYSDILYTNIGANVGNAVANRFNFEFSLKNVALLQPDHTKINPFFLESLLNNERQKNHILSSFSKGGAQKFITLKVLRNTRIIAPKIDLQNRFAEIVVSLERIKKQNLTSVQASDALFSSLQQRAFNGQLFTEQAYAAAQQKLFAD